MTDDKAPEPLKDTETELSFDQVDTHIREQAALQTEKKTKRVLSDEENCDRSIHSHRKYHSVGSTRAFRSGWDICFGGKGE